MSDLPAPGVPTPDVDRQSTRQGAQASAEVSPSHARLLNTAIELIGQNGFRSVTVAQMSKSAHVSSATFYSLFQDKEACFIAAHQQLTGTLLRELESTTDAPAWREVVARLFDLAAREPNSIRVLADEATMGVGRALEERDRLIDSLEAFIQDRQAAYSQETTEPDIPAKALLGSTLRLLVRRLRTKHGSLQDLHDGIVHWAECYSVRRMNARWQSLAPIPGISARSASYASVLDPPLRPPRGRSRLTPKQTARNQRERIIHATATVTATNGYEATTVADIVAAAGLAREVFYRHFKDKQDAFLHAYETSFQALMTLVIRVFFTSADWPERVWKALRVSTDFMVNFSSFAHLGMVESSTLPLDAIEITEQRMMACTVFLHEGFREKSDPTKQPQIVSEAIAMAIYEISAYLLRNDRGSEFPGMTPLLSYISLTPFTGHERASAFLQEKATQHS